MLHGQAAGAEEPQSLPLRSIFVTFVRHGQSADNAAHVWAGHKDSPLTSMGLAQAKALGEAFASTHIDAIYSSDLKRASQTANELLNHNDTVPPPPLVQTQSLREQNFGQAEGRKADEVDGIRLAGGSADAATSRSRAYPDGESLDQVNARLATAVRRFILPRLEGLRGKSLTDGHDGHVCIVAHGIAIAELLRVFMSYHDNGSQYGLPWSDPKLTYQRVRLENTGWSRLQLSVPAREATAGCLDPKGSQIKERRGHAPDSSSDPKLDTSNDTVASTLAEGASIAVTGERPPRHDVFVRFVGHQNQTSHLRSFPSAARPRSSTLSRPSSALTHPGQNGRQDTGNHVLSQYPRESSPVNDINRYDQYSSSFMSRAIALGSAEGLSVFDGKVSAPKAPARLQSDGEQSESSAIREATAPNGVLWEPTFRQDARLMFPPPVVTTSSNSHSESWQIVLTKVLPLFDIAHAQPGLKGSSISLPIEELNDHVSAHIRRALEKSPARANAALSTDFRGLLITALGRLLNSSGGPGQPSFASSAEGNDEMRMLTALAKVWIAFFSTTLHLVEAIFLPLGTDSVLQSLSSGSATSAAAMAAATGGGSNSTAPQPSLSREAILQAGQVPSSNAASHLSPPGSFHATSATNGAGQIPSGASPLAGAVSPSVGASPLRSFRIDVRKMALCAFRDVIVLPHFERLFVPFARMGDVQLQGLDVEPHLNASYSAKDGAPKDIRNGAEGQEGSFASSIRRLTQMSHLLRSVQSGDEAQKAIDGLVKVLRAGSSSIYCLAGLGGPFTAHNPRTWPRDQNNHAGPAKSASASGKPVVAGEPGLGLGLSMSTSTTTPPALNSIRAFGLAGLDHTAASSGDRSSNRHGWIPRSAAKHGLHAASASESASSGSSIFGASRSALRGERLAHEQAYLNALKETGRFRSEPRNDSDSSLSSPAQQSRTSAVSSPAGGHERLSPQTSSSPALNVSSQRKTPVHTAHRSTYSDASAGSFAAKAADLSLSRDSISGADAATADQATEEEASASAQEDDGLTPVQHQRARFPDNPTAEGSVDTEGSGPSFESRSPDLSHGTR